VVPFEEGGDAPDDEKKIDEGDELMGKQPTRRNYLQDEEAEEPPSLALRKPFMKRAKTTGNLVKPKTSSFSQWTPPDRKKEMQQHLKFAALKRDIFSMNKPPPHTLNTIAMTF
jgi:hypothetical protein